MLEKAPQLEPQTLLLHLEQLRPGEEWYGRKRTLQRRVEQWRALHGPAQEEMFLQEHRAGVLGISDFTLLKGEPITVAGEVLEHRLFHFRLPYSGWCHVAGTPSRYRELCAHLGVVATRNNRGVAHENGAIEGPHGHWKHRLEQQLIQRGSRDFATEAEYRQLVAHVTNTLNSRYQVQGNLEIEQLHLQPLPVERFADYEPVVARVRSTSTIEVRSVTYSVPSRLIGQQLTVHLRHDRLDLFMRSQDVETLPRLHRRAGESGPLRRIDFRHMIESLRHKPRALLRAQLQSDLLPGENWRQLWRLLLAALPPDEAAKVTVDALHVAACTDDLDSVERYLRRQLRRGELNLTALPQLDIPEHTLSSYDELLVGTPEQACAGNGSASDVETVETAPVPQPVAGGRAAGHSRWLESSQLPQCAGGAGTPAAASSPSAAAVA
jgi:hypothetical protein